MTRSNGDEYPSGSAPLKPIDSTLYVKLDSEYMAYSAISNAGLEGDQMILLNGTQSIVSYPN